MINHGNGDVLLGKLLVLNSIANAGIILVLHGRFQDAGRRVVAVGVRVW